MQQKPKTAEKIKEEQRGDGKQARHSRQLSEGSEGGEGEEKLRWRVHWLEKEKLELTTSHNQEVRSSRAMQVITKNVSLWSHEQSLFVISAMQAAG